MKKLIKYVKLIVNMGIHIQKGEKLLIWCAVDAAYFARMIMEEAYKAGAENVVISWVDETSDRIAYLLAPDSQFGGQPKWQLLRNQYWADEGYKMLWVFATDPEALKGVDPERIAKNQTIMPPIAWTTVNVPTPAWARMVFPDATSDEQATKLLWQAIFAASRIDENDPITNWEKHIATLQCRVDTLTAYNFRYLRFKNGIGTDLKIELPQDHLWIACIGETVKGEKFITNIPTEEVFTAPLRTGVNGIAYATRPLVFMGGVIENFWIRFKDGKVVEYAAEKNSDLLDKLLNAHENAKYLGEVAIVPHSSPISQLEIIWYDSSFDENAACHLAFGKAYPQALKNAASKSENELITMGLNQAPIHEDFMIGSADMDIIGITQEGKEVCVFKNGEWIN